jgi:ubiquinone/menaquinone biosynthesis C-methylase UbiE
MSASKSTEAPIFWSGMEQAFGNGSRSRHELPLPRRDAYRMLLRLHRKRLAGISRTRSNGAAARSTRRVAEIYEHEYLVPAREFARKRDRRRDLFLVKGRPVYVDGWFTFEYRTELLDRAIEATGARRVLEVGSGRGVLLALLALRRPELDLAGIELTAEGVARSLELVVDPLPELVRLSGVDSITDEQRAALARIEVTQGNAAEMPFPDGSFDVSYSCLSLEQMPESIPAVLAEMARVTRSYCVFLEPFADANGPLGRAQLRALDYFRSSVGSLREYGLERVHFTTAIPQKVRFKTGLLVARVMRP